jgi:hypothetical protein
MVDYLRKRAARISDRAVLLPPSRLRKKRCSEMADVRFGSMLLKKGRS